MDKTDKGIDVHKVIPISIDLKTGKLIDFHEYLSNDEFAKLCEDAGVKISKPGKRFQNYNDYEYLLKAKAQPWITLFLTSEGLVVLGDRGTYTHNKG